MNINRGRQMRARRTHGCSKTTIDFENSKFVQILGILWLGKVCIGNNLICSGGLDPIPIAMTDVRFYFLTKSNDIQVNAFSALSEITGEEIEEGLHLCVERLSHQ